MKSLKELEDAEAQIVEKKEPVSYDTREYPVEVLINKFLNGEFIIPNYQREFVWEKDKEKMSRFIESIILDLPIPYLFFADEFETGKLEIVDGSQRIRTLSKFYNDEFELFGLDVLDLLNGFKYSDLIESRQRRFLRKTLRSIELTEKASSEVRRDLFARINTKPYDLLPMEVRKGIFDGVFYNFIEECSKHKLFRELCPISGERAKRGEAQELVLRYFAFADNYQKFIHRVDDFLDDYMKDKHENGFDKNRMKDEFEKMLAFVKTYFPTGFRKTASFNSIARVRYEAISVGVTLALRDKPNLVPPDIMDWINSSNFKTHTTSDASNNRLKVIGRIEYVKNKLLE
ncbi:MAG: DUF262 domain-containing protein [Chitinophagales bacterium]|nr:DUF262 domain-containing protein [Chitinophagales bacterium]